VELPGFFFCNNEERCAFKASPDTTNEHASLVLKKYACIMEHYARMMDGVHVLLRVCITSMVVEAQAQALMS
jgi:hypothetical protein